MAWTENSIVALLNSNDRAVERAILFLYSQQTSDERVTSSTRHDNARGFSAADASRGSYYARWILGYDRQGNRRYPNRRLTGSHLDKARDMVLKYRRQLLAEAIRREAEKVQNETGTGPRWTEPCDCCVFIGRSGALDLYFPMEEPQTAAARFGAAAGDVLAVEWKYDNGSRAWLVDWHRAVAKHHKALTKLSKLWALYQDQRDKPEGQTAYRILQGLKKGVEQECSEA